MVIINYLLTTFLKMLKFFERVKNYLLTKTKKKSKISHAFKQLKKSQNILKKLLRIKSGYIKIW